LPDGGFFSSKELKKHPDETSLFALKPERGVLEVEADQLRSQCARANVASSHYLEHYGQILLTNYRSFALWTWEAGSLRRARTFFLAESESLFWELARQPREHPRLGERLFEISPACPPPRCSPCGTTRPRGLPRQLRPEAAPASRERRAILSHRSAKPLVRRLASASRAKKVLISFVQHSSRPFLRSLLCMVLWNEGNPKRVTAFAGVKQPTTLAFPSCARFPSTRRSAEAPRPRVGGSARLDRINPGPGRTC